MDRVVTLDPTIRIENDMRGPEVRKLLASFNKDSFVIVDNKLHVIVDNSIYYQMDLTGCNNYPAAFQINMLPEDENTLLYNKGIYDFVAVKINAINYGHFIRIAHLENARNNPEFEELLALKADQGMKRFKLPDEIRPGKLIMIPMFAGFPKVNKGEDIGLEVFKDAIQSNLVVHMSIYKKKFGRVLHMYFRILDI